VTALAGCGRKARGFPGYAFVANQEGRSVAAVDLSRFAVARRIPLDARPDNVIAHPSRPLVYVLAAENGTVYEIEAGTLAIKRRARAGQSCVSMRLAGAGDSLWVLSREPRALVRLPFDTLRATSRIALPHEPAGFELDRRREGSTAAVGFSDDRGVALCNLAAGAVTTTVSGGARPRVAGFRSDGKYLMLGNAPERNMTILDVSTGKIVVRLPMPLEPANFCVTPDGGQLFVTGPGMDAVVILAPYSTEVSETVLAGRAPGRMAISSAPGAPAYLFVANPETGDVTVLDVDTRKVVVVVHVGVEPGQILFTPDNQYALVLNGGSGDIAVIRIGAFTNGPNSGWAQRNRRGALFTLIPVGARPVGAAVVRA
jgi:YVTN family beta-propeller protein